MGRVNFCRADYVFILLLSWIFFQPPGLLAYVMDKGLPFMKVSPASAHLLTSGGGGRGVLSPILICAGMDWAVVWQKYLLIGTNIGDTNCSHCCNAIFFLQSSPGDFFLSNMEHIFFPVFLSLEVSSNHWHQINTNVGRHGPKESPIPYAMETLTCNELRTDRFQ